MASKALFVASTGGHLEQLYQLAPTLRRGDQTGIWVTFDSPQSRSLLQSESEVIYIRRIGSRGYLDLIRSIVPAWRLLLRLRPDDVYSTGAAIALAFLPFGRLIGARATYVESAARTQGPSVTGRVLSLLPWVRLGTQYRSWAGRRWVYRGSVFDGYEVGERSTVGPIRRMLVTLGTQEGYPFVALVARLQQIVPAGVEVLWQIGEGFPAHLRPDGAHEMVPRSQLQEWIAECDVVVAHAGVGSALTLIDNGRVPVIVPRRAARGEHIDDHQQLIADALSSRGLAVSVSPDDLTWDHLVEAAGLRVTRSGAHDARA